MKSEKAYTFLCLLMLGIVNLYMLRMLLASETALLFITETIEKGNTAILSKISETSATQSQALSQNAAALLSKPDSLSQQGSSQALVADTPIDPLTGKHQQRGNIKAAIVILTRNREQFDLQGTIEIFEQRFNSKYHYPYVFLNEEPFTDEFKEAMQSVTSSKCSFGLIDKAKEWSYPDWIDHDRARKGREELIQKRTPYGGSESYRFMCRYQSGFFFRHPLLNDYEFYWRVEPATKLTCNVDYDPFEVMQKGKYKYGFTIAIHEIMETVPTLWKSTLEFAEEKRKRDPNFNPTLLRYFTDDEDKHSYNGHHFWSNFEIGSLDFLRSKDYIDYFEFLEKKGGFFYERWGDAPVHSLGVGLFLKKSEVFFFEDIGYFHNPFSHCPFNKEVRLKKKCTCDPANSISLEGYSCLSNFYLYKERRFW